MNWIGFDRNDPNQTTFEFDDTQVLNGETPKYNIVYCDSRQQGTIPCGDVFKLKPLKMKKVKLTPPPTEVVEENTDNNSWNEEEIQQDILNELKPKFNNEQVETVEKPKKVSKKKVEEPKISTQIQNHKYEYKTIVDDFENINSFEEKLNKLGEESWDLVNFKVISNTIFSNKSKLFCILKRNKL